MIIAFILSCSLSLYAQGPGWGKKWDKAGKGCISLEEMNLSEEQQKTLSQIKAIYWDEMLRLRYKLMGKCLELKMLVRDPGAGAEAIRAKGQEIEMVRSQFQRKALDYQIEVRKVLTPEQMRSWCTLVGAPFMRGLGRGL